MMSHGIRISEQNRIVAAELARLRKERDDLREALERLMFAIAPDMNEVARPSMEPFFVEPFDQARKALATPKPASDEIGE